jgi:hypothetical protein
VERNSPIHSKISAIEKEDAVENEAKTEVPDLESI